MRRRRVIAVVPLLAALAATGCGSSNGGGGSGDTGQASTPKPAATGDPAAQIKAASRSAAADFPKPGGRSLQALAQTLKHSGFLAPAASTFVPGTQRIPFALLNDKQRFVYGETAVYVADSPKSPARGPYPAPADDMEVAPRYLSKTSSADPNRIRAVYEANVPLPRAGRFPILSVTRTPQGLMGGTATVIVRARSPIPGPGQPAPRIHTPTVKSAGGDLAIIDTRVPHDDMHRVDFASVVGREPVALLFATPALCQSRVCGPVTDIMLQLEQRYRGRVAFIHQEVYRANNPNKGLRPQLVAFHLQSEPWLFTVDRQGRIAARVEGAFGLRSADAAIRAALR